MLKDWFTKRMTDAGEAAWSRWRDERLRNGLREWETPDKDLSPLAALQAASPCPLDADTLPARMTALQVAALFDDVSEHLYTGPREGAKNPKNVCEAGDFVRRACHGIRNVAGVRLRFRLQEFIMPNPVKAEGGLAKDGTPSYRCDDAVAALRNTVVEVDPAWKGEEGGEAERAFYAGAVREQAFFWLGVVTSRVGRRGLMPLPVRSIVYNGIAFLISETKSDNITAEGTFLRNGRVGRRVCAVSSACAPRTPGVWNAPASPSSARCHRRKRGERPHRAGSP
jgi:hypothetical protein